MNGFHPMNVESEEESEEEIDDSNEIQIEEALKLYQNALKLHSQGPNFHDEAEAAYHELFASEIFTWEDSPSAARGVQPYDVGDSDDDVQDSLTPIHPDSVLVGANGTPNSLPQILYLAYKNHGQFLLDRLRHRLSRIEYEINSGSYKASSNIISEDVSSSLSLFVKALNKDDTDLELWRLTSRIAGFLGSRRVARYCLEAVLDNEDESLDAWTEPLGLEAGFAKEQLQPLLTAIDDELSQTLVSHIFKKHKKIIASFRRRIDPCPYLPTTPSSKIHDENEKYLMKKCVIHVPLASWASCGKAILLQLSQEAQGINRPEPGVTYSLAFPSNNEDTMTASPPKRSPSHQNFVQINQTPIVGEEELVSPLSRSLDTTDNNAAVRLVAEPSVASSRPPQESLQSNSENRANVGNPESQETAGTADTNQAPLQVDPAQADTIPNDTISLPPRKRSSETAELPDATDTGRSKSKRIKTRGSWDPDSLKDSTAEDWARWFEQQLQMYHHADDLAFGSTSKVLSKLDVSEPITLQPLRDILSRQPSNDTLHHESTPSQPMDSVLQDLKSTLNGWDTERSKAFLNGYDPKDPAGGIWGSCSPGFAAFLENSDRGSPKLLNFKKLPDHHVKEFVKDITRQEWISLEELAYRWLLELLTPHTAPRCDNQSWYESHAWPDTLKESVVQMLVFQDHAIHAKIHNSVSEIEQQPHMNQQGSTHLPQIFNSHIAPVADLDETRRKYTGLVQTFFELHLDVYGRITNPSSKVDDATRTLQHDRLGRWAGLASRVNNQCSWPRNQSEQRSESMDDIHIRFLWATVVCNSLLEPASRENTILCYQDLIHIIQALPSGQQDQAPFVIELPNNAIMPEISIEAARKEISRLTTMDFFIGVFDPDNTDPLAVIESLEPLLDLSVRSFKLSENLGYSPQNEEMMPTVQQVDTLSTDQVSSLRFDACSDQRMVEALRFFEQSSLPLKLYLWQKLRDAYRAIAYSPQVLSCDLRMTTVIMDYLKSSSYIKTSPENRRDSLLRWLHRLDDHLTRILTITTSSNEAFDCLDFDHVRTALETLTLLQKTLHVFALWEDTIRVGKTQPPAPANQHGMRGLAKSTDKFRDMIVKTWTLQYMILKESMLQNLHLFGSPDQELTKHLEHVHQVLGLRCYCSLANKVFLKLMKKEYESFKCTEGWDIDMSQLMYDLYGVKVSLNAMDLQDHACLTETLDRRTALEIMDLVMAQVNRISMKDLLRSDLKFTVDRMQQVIMIPNINKSTARTFNFRSTNLYLKSPLNPSTLYRSLRGIGGLNGTVAYDEGSDIAAKGWYSLLGNIALAKFRSLKRSSAGSTDDLSISRAFLKHDLEFDIGRWETWYTLAQVYDATIEEDTTWTADKLDNHMDDLADLQRKAIHCYSLALALATQSAVGSFEDTSKIANLCADFGSRIYASTREPFSMKAFSLESYKRHYNSRAVGMYQDFPFRSMQLYSAWKFASILLRRASVQKPQDWLTSYTYGKVLWKMHNCGEDIRGPAKRIGYQPAIDAFIRAVEACPEKRDSRHADKDPILEPHYKLVSVVHKLVRSKRTSAEEGLRILKATPYARNISDFKGDEGWNGHIWQILKTLRAADKVNWHHRMVARAAHIMYDADPNDPRNAVGARNELSQQIFTKTMTLQVWKPDNERPGRHFVYTGLYVRFFTRLLYQLNDKTSLEALARRIRKRSVEFFHHASVWEEVCRAYLKLLHHQPYCPITEGYAELVFQGMDPENFQTHAARLETYVHFQQTSLPLLDILREAIELKKLNNNLFRPITFFEELIRDIYAHLYDSIVPGLIKYDAAEENRVRMRVDNILSNPIPAVETPPPDGVGVQDGEQPKKTGARYVTQREIVRKAEAIAAKPAPTVPTKVLKPLAPAPAMESGVEMGTRPLIDAPRLSVVINTDGANDAGSSAPGSVHDSADDESELSEVDDEGVEAEPLEPAEPEEPEEPEVKDTALVRVPMFPNLQEASTDNAEEVDEDIGDEREGEEEVVADEVNQQLTDGTVAEEMDEQGQNG